MRLLFVLNEALFFTTHRMPIALAAKAAGAEIHVAAPHDAPYVQMIEAAGLTFHHIPLQRSGLAVGGELKLIWALARLIRTVKPDLMHCVTMKPVLYGGALARLLGVRSLVSAITGLGYLFLTAGTKTRIIRAIVLKLYRFALAHAHGRAIFQNPDDLALFQARRLVDPAIVVMIKGCGVDMQAFPAVPEPADPVTVMFPARIVGDKGVREFVEAARILKARGTPARFVLVGRNDPINPTSVPEDEIRGWERDGLVEWWGFSQDMPASLARSHIICMPSYREGLPRGLIEAAATGRAIVTADAPGCREVVRDGETGFLVPVGDGPATADAIGRLIDNPALRHRFADAARAFAVAEFSVEKFVADSLDVYRDLEPGLQSR